jgi:hypothetical protein
MRASRPLSVSPDSEDKRRRPPSTSVSSVQFEEALPRRWPADPEETHQPTDGPSRQERHDHPAHDDHSQRAGPSVVEPRTLLSRRVSVVTGGYESSGSDVAPALPTSSSRGFQELKTSRKGPDAGSDNRRSRASSGTGRHVRHPQTPKSKGKARERLGGDLAASLGLDRGTKELALTPGMSSPGRLLLTNDRSDPYPAPRSRSSFSLASLWIALRSRTASRIRGQLLFPSEPFHISSGNTRPVHCPCACASDRLKPRSSASSQRELHGF